MEAVQAIEYLYRLIDSIREAARNVKEVPKNAKALADNAERFRNRLRELEKHQGLHKCIEKYIGGARYELEEVCKFLLALCGKGKLKKWLHNKSIKNKFKEFQLRLEHRRDELNADVIGFLAANPSDPVVVQFKLQPAHIHAAQGASGEPTTEHKQTQNLGVSDQSRLTPPTNATHANESSDTGSGSSSANHESSCKKSGL